MKFVPLAIVSRLMALRGVFLRFTAVLSVYRVISSFVRFIALIVAVRFLALVVVMRFIALVITVRFVGISASYCCTLYSI